MSTSADLPTEERLKAAAVRLFGAKGFAATGIRELARESGISVASLYHYMQTKDDLLLSLMLDGMHSLLTPATEALESAGDAADLLCALVDIHINFHCSRAALARVTDAEIRALSGEARQQVISLRDEYERLWRQAIVAGDADGTFHVPQPRLTTFALLEMCTGVSHWYSPNGMYSVRAISSYYSALALRMLGYRRSAVIRRFESQGSPVAS
jgi:AcrR family transcriptional regulator